MKTKKFPKKQRTILLIDDETSWLEAIRSIMQNEPFNVITAKSGEDALAKLKNKKPDLILSDVRMPAMNGFELYEKIRENPKLASVPFVFMSSIGDYDARQVAKKLGVEDYIEKPFDTGQVKIIVNALLSRFENR